MLHSPKEPAMPGVSDLPTTPAKDPSHLDFEINGKPFHADPTTIGYANTRLKLDDVIYWSLSGERTTVNAAQTDRRGVFMVETLDEELLMQFAVEGGIVGKRITNAQYETLRTNLHTFGTIYIDPKIPQNMIRAVLKGQTVKTSHGGKKLILSREGLTRREGKMFRKQDVCYPWSDYQGCSENAILLRSEGRTVELKTAKFRWDLPTVLDSLAEQLR
jgi:hypothetical protein